jgi:hypothetical protein
MTENPTAEPAWIRASQDDFAGIDFEAPIRASNKADSRELSDAFEKAAQQNPGTKQENVFGFLAALTGMHFKPDDKSDPFGPMFVLENRRSAIPSDFRSRIDILTGLAERAEHPTLRSILSDMSWLLDRSKATLGTKAIESYVTIVRQVDDGRLTFSHVENAPALSNRAKKLVQRALQIARATDWNSAASLSARTLVVELRARAADHKNILALQWFSDLDLQFGITESEKVAEEIEKSILLFDLKGSEAADLWRIAARGYRYARKKEDEDRCKVEAAKCLAAEAERVFELQNSAMIASSVLSDAISELHGVSGQRDYRTKLSHRLIDIQSRLNEEMGTFSHEMDIRDLAQETEKAVEKLSLKEMFFYLVALAKSPLPEELRQEARKSIEEHPLASLFGATYHDSEGKVIHRTTGAGIGEDDEFAIRNQISQADSIRRHLIVSSQIDVVRRAIVKNAYVSDDTVTSLLRYSPFIPKDVLFTFSRGVCRFIQGDFASALYILTPLLENSLRYVLKNHGHNVTIFDDATQTQQDRTISNLFLQMRNELNQIFSEAIVQDLERVFLQKPGPYLRHSIAHGLLHDGDPFGPDAIYGCWLILKLSLAPLFKHRDKIPDLA